MEKIRFTKETVEKFIVANEGYESSNRNYSSGKFKATTSYYIKNGVVHKVEDTNRMEERDDSILDIEGARKFFKSELIRPWNKLVIPDLI